MLKWATKLVCVNTLLVLCMDIECVYLSLTRFMTQLVNAIVVIHRWKATNSVKTGVTSAYLLR